MQCPIDVQLCLLMHVEPSYEAFAPSQDQDHGGDSISIGLAHTAQLSMSTPSNAVGHFV